MSIEAQGSLIVDSHTCFVQRSNSNNCMSYGRNIASLEDQTAKRRLVEIWNDLEDGLVTEQREVLEFVLVVETVGIWEVQKSDCSVQGSRPVC